DAVVLRFLQEKPFKDVSAALGTSEPAAKKRVARAIEKLRAILAREGVTLSVGALATALAASVTLAAPAPLTAGLAVTALAGSKGGAGATSAVVISKGVMQMMRWLKL